MKTGNYWGSAEHRKMIAEEKKEVLHLVRELTEKYLTEPHTLTKMIIEDQHAYYKRLTEYRYD